MIVRSLLEKADGFVDTGVQERFDECEAVMSDVLRNIRSVGSQWKVCNQFDNDDHDHLYISQPTYASNSSLKLVLPRSKYFNAIGSVTEAALTKVLEDILALGDIPELDSQKLCELCQILNALEGLFIDDSDPEMVGLINIRFETAILVLKGYTIDLAAIRCRCPRSVVVEVLISIRIIGTWLSPIIYPREILTSSLGRNYCRYFLSIRPRSADRF